MAVKGWKNPTHFFQNIYFIQIVLTLSLQQKNKKENRENQTE